MPPVETAAQNSCSLRPFQPPLPRLAIYTHVLNRGGLGVESSLDASRITLQRLQDKTGAERPRRRREVWVGEGVAGDERGMDTLGVRGGLRSYVAATEYTLI